MDSSARPAATPLTDDAAGQITRAEELAYELTIAEVMTPEPRVVTPQTRMADLLETMRGARISGMPVVEAGQLAGVVSLEDLVRAMSVGDLMARVDAYMTRDTVVVCAADPVVEALKTFTKSRVGRLPVVGPDGGLVGILTKGDITRGLLRVLQKEFQAEEVRRYRASHLFEDIESSRTSLILRYNVQAHDFAAGGHASSCLKRALLRLGASPLMARRCAIAVYEAEMNLVIHTLAGGFIRAEVEPHRILVKVVDDGPGILDVEQAMQPGFSTATAAVRELGFGAGMGLPNIKRCVDKLSIKSAAGGSTKLEMVFYLPASDSLREAPRAPAEE
ncbi:MAG: CBS domain-containing protein [Anaerolineales bacterium]|nr:CBS domain-containing protein [Anaerolineales bacterium]